MLGKKAINLNEPLQVNLQNELILDEKVYMNYKNAYIKKEGTEEILFWQIVANKLKDWRDN